MGQWQVDWLTWCMPLEGGPRAGGSAGSQVSSGLGLRSSLGREGCLDEECHRIGVGMRLGMGTQGEGTSAPLVKPISLMWNSAFASLTALQYVLATGMDTKVCSQTCTAA